MVEHAAVKEAQLQRETAVEKSGEFREAPGVGTATDGKVGFT